VIRNKKQGRSASIKMKKLLSPPKVSNFLEDAQHHPFESVKTFHLKLVPSEPRTMLKAEYKHTTRTVKHESYFDCILNLKAEKLNVPTKSIFSFIFSFHKFSILDIHC